MVSGGGGTGRDPPRAHATSSQNKLGTPRSLVLTHRGPSSALQHIGASDWRVPFTGDFPYNGLRKNILFISNVNSNPNDSCEQFKMILKKSVDLDGTHPLVVIGDLNAPYGLLRYVYDTSKGQDLWHTANEMNLMLITDKALPTRFRNSFCQDTTPIWPTGRTSTEPSAANLQ
ncbi:hypothetical protein HPB50_025285 [Hyalomma asiaticum]|uniref:Uncharacterized protein n=1 Tax=Hyalomma asiaticum TaxID=266040 RepID=A0ACB7SSI8_HYAAI|nr:hypothetical protein HPB50_025285 [Hyalomma asiaticum]